jgi:hypothetical protein
MFFSSEEHLPFFISSPAKLPHRFPKLNPLLLKAAHNKNQAVI